MDEQRRRPGRPRKENVVDQDDQAAAHDEFIKLKAEASKIIDQDTDHDDMIHADEDYDERWDDGVLLASPPERPGFVQRWVRVKLDGKPDMRNLIRRKNQMYRPRMADTAPNFESTMWGEDNVIGNEEVVLMERPKNLHSRQVERQIGMSKRQMDQVQRSMFKQAAPGDGFGGVRYDEDRTNISKGRPASVADDPAL